MKTALIIVAFVAGVCVADVSHIVDKPVEILQDDRDSEVDGSYHWSYQGADGTGAQAQGSPDGQVQGSYHYVDKEGNPIEVTYTAGVEGFVPQGASILQVPESVVRTLEWNAAHPEEEKEEEHHHQPSQQYPH